MGRLVDCQIEKHLLTIGRLETSMLRDRKKLFNLPISQSSNLPILFASNLVFVVKLNDWLNL